MTGVICNVEAEAESESAFVGNDDAEEDDIGRDGRSDHTKGARTFSRAALRKAAQDFIAYLTRMVYPRTVFHLHLRKRAPKIAELSDSLFAARESHFL